MIYMKSKKNKKTKNSNENTKKSGRQVRTNVKTYDRNSK